MASRTLYILCGGQSRRMGTDKALLEINGRSLLERWIQRASPFFKEVVLLCGSDRYDLDVRQLQDSMPDAGPLSGLLSAMMDPSAGSDYFALAAADVPNLTDSTMNLLATKKPQDNPLCIASCGDEMQPLTGIYHRSLSKDLTRYLNSGERSVMGFIRQTEPAFFEVKEQELLNINEPDAWQDFLRQNSTDFNDPAF